LVITFDVALLSVIVVLSEISYIRHFFFDPIRKRAAIDCPLLAFQVCVCAASNPYIGRVRFSCMFVVTLYSIIKLPFQQVIYKGSIGFKVFNKSVINAPSFAHSEKR
jgi:hypothetical protein